MNRIYNSVAVPRGLYGFEVVPIHEPGLWEMEKAQKSLAKVGLTIPKKVTWGQFMGLRLTY